MSASSVNYAARALRLRLPRVCVAITGEDAGEMLDKAESAVREVQFLEFRLDYLAKPETAISKIKQLYELRPDVITIATCRRVQGGGRFKGTVAAQTEILAKAAAAGCQIVDLELESAEAMKASELEKFRSNLTAFLISSHDFKATKKLEETFERMKRFNPDFYKLVTTATNLRDNVTMKKFLQSTSDHHFVIGLCMGEQGIISRVLGVRAGSVFTFGAANRGEETGPGQVTMRELRDVYRIENVDAVTRVYGVAGDPVSHSLSPFTMNTGFRRENVHAVFLPLPSRGLDDLMACVREIPIHGMAVTMPYKQEIVQHLDNSDVVTQQTGACNTVVRGQDGKLYGFNTDVAGIVTPLEEHIALQGAKVLVLGAGGAARAAIYGVKQRGADVYILNRTPQTAQALARKMSAKTIKRSDLAKMDFDVIINATPVGMGNPKVSPLDEKELKAKIIFDLVYNPYETKLLSMARAQNLIAISGVEMFVHQGARQFEIWTGKPAPIDEMRLEVFRQLGEKPIPPTPAAAQRAAAAAERELREAAAMLAFEQGGEEPPPPMRAPTKPVRATKSAKIIPAGAKPAITAPVAPAKPVAAPEKPVAKLPAKAAAPAVKAAAPTKPSAKVAAKAAAPVKSNGNGKAPAKASFAKSVLQKKANAAKKPAKKAPAKVAAAKKLSTAKSKHAPAKSSKKRR
jgi:3-dehydroquinate dehydratase / shikimate dehydrogenase